MSLVSLSREARERFLLFVVLVIHALALNKMGIFLELAKRNSHKTHKPVLKMIWIT